MALTRITKGVIKPNENYDTHNINSTGIITAVGADFSGNVSVGGVLTYEDVTSIDSVGIITAQKDIHVGAGVSVVGIVTASTFKGDGDFVDIDVDGHTNLDNVSIAGITTFSGIIDAINTPASIRVAQDIQHKGDADTKISFPANDTITAETGGNERVRITSAGRVAIGTDTIPSQGLFFVGVQTSSNNYISQPSARFAVEPASSPHGDASAIHIGQRAGGSADPAITFHRRSGGTAWNSWGARIHQGGLDSFRFSFSLPALPGSHSFTDEMTIKRDAGVGIGTVAPREKLDVVGHIKLDSGPVLENSSSGDVLRVTSPTGYMEVGSRNASYAHLTTNVSRFYFNKKLIVDEGIISAYDSHDLLLTTGSSPTTSDTGIFIKNSTNKVGIGTDNPNTELEVFDDAFTNITIHSARTSGNIGGLDFRKGGGTSGIQTAQYFVNTTGEHFFHSQGSERLKIASDGDLTITGSDNAELKLRCGTSTGDNVIAFLNSSGTTKGNIFYDSDNNFMVFKTDGTASSNERFRITSGGDLIHTSNEKTFSLVSTRNVSGAGTKIAFFGANRYDTDEEFAAIRGLLVSNSGGSGKQNGSLQFIVGSASHTHAMTQGGNVGFGTGNPQALLHLQGEGGGNTSGLYFKNGPHDVVRQYFSNGNDNSDFVITYDGTGGAELTLHADGNLGLNESNGDDVLIGRTTSINVASTATSKLQVHHGAGNISAAFYSNADALGPGGVLALGHSRSTDTGVLQDDDVLGEIRFAGADGNDIETMGALISAEVNGTPSSNVMPTDLVFSTNAGSGSVTETMRINKAGFVKIGSGSPVSKLTVSGDIYFSNSALISNFDANGVGGTNIDHIWHSDAANYGRGGTWNFVSDTSYKATGNSAIQIGYLANSGGGHLIGDVGIGLTTISRGPLHVHENSSDDCEIHLTNNDTGTTSSDGLTIFADTDTQGIWSRENCAFDIACNNTRSLRLHNSGGLSINNTSKSTLSMLQVDNHGDRDTGTNMNESQFVIFNDAHFTGSQNVTANRSKAGIRNDVEYSCSGNSGTSSGSRASVFGIHTDINATKYAYVNDGVYSFVKSTADNQSSRTITLRGIYGYAQGYLTSSSANVNIHGGYFLGYRGGDVTSGHCYGIYARAHNTNGTNNTGDLTGVYSEWEQDDASTITNAYCFRGYGDRDAGTITNSFILYGSHGGDGSITNRWGIYISDSAKNYVAGNFECSGTLEKGGGTFRINHPLPALKDKKDLVHSFIEGPQMDLIYRGKVDLVNGTASVNIDTKAGMTEGTFVILCRDIQCFTSNETGWTAVKGSVTGNIITIVAQDNTCTDTISWMVVGERQDDTVKSLTMTDDNGDLIVEPDRSTHYTDNYNNQPECEKNIYNET